MPKPEKHHMETCRSARVLMLWPSGVVRIPRRGYVSSLSKIPLWLRHCAPCADCKLAKKLRAKASNTAEWVGKSSGLSSGFGAQREHEKGPDTLSLCTEKNLVLNCIFQIIDLSEDNILSKPTKLFKNIKKFESLYFQFLFNLGFQNSEQIFVYVYNFSLCTHTVFLGDP